MPRTNEDLARVALQRLGEVGDGQAPSPEAMCKVRDALPGILDDLSGRGIYDAPADGLIDDVAMRHLSAIVASEMSDEFGVPQAETATLAARAQGAVARLRELRAQPYARRPQCVDYF